MIKVQLMILTLVFVFIFVARGGTGIAQTSSSAESKIGAAPALSDVQKQAIKRLHEESEKRAAPVALRLAGIVNKIYENLLAEKTDDELRPKLSSDMKEAVWELLAIKGESIRETVNILTPDQKALIKIEMRKPGAPSDLEEVIARTFNLKDK